MCKYDVLTFIVHIAQYGVCYVDSEYGYKLFRKYCWYGRNYRIF